MKNIFRFTVVLVLLFLLMLPTLVAQDDTDSLSRQQQVNNSSNWILRATFPTSSESRIIDNLNEANTIREDSISLLTSEEFYQGFFNQERNIFFNYETFSYTYQVLTESGEIIGFTDLFAIVSEDDALSNGVKFEELRRNFSLYVFDSTPDNNANVVRSAQGVADNQVVDDNLTIIHPASEQDTAGGPGGPPRKIMVNDLDYSFTFPGLTWSEVDSFKKVAVVILDAPPNLSVFDDGNPRVFMESGTNSSQMLDILRRKFDPDDNSIEPSLHIGEYVRDSGTNVCMRKASSPTDLSTDSSPLGSHGLFIASVVLSIVGEQYEENIIFELVSVFDTDGKGDLATLLKQLTCVNETFDKSVPIIYNMSLHTIVPDACKDALKGDGSDCGELIRLIDDVLADADPGRVTFVAAAGNYTAIDENDNPVERPREAFPAAFHGVIGVGSTSWPNGLGEADISDFSHYAESNDDEGIYVLGEEIVGVYVEANFPVPLVGTGTPTPTPEPNDYGWASWSGTSFSTAIVSGMIARNLISLYPVPIKSPGLCSQDFEFSQLQNDPEACYIPVAQGISTSQVPEVTETPMPNATP